jgi:hypothetical protein
MEAVNKAPKLVLLTLNEAKPVDQDRKVTR